MIELIKLGSGLEYVNLHNSIVKMTNINIVAPLLAFLACLTSGVTSFGDGVVFLMGWSFYQLADHDEEFTLTQAIIFITILPLASLPALVWAARKEIQLTWAYGTFLTVSSAATTPLGILFLIYGM